jgi:hypothetical protein
MKAYQRWRNVISVSMYQCINVEAKASNRNQSMAAKMAAHRLKENQ